MKNGANKERKYVVSGNNLRGCRKALGVTQQELAEMVANLPGSSREKCSFKTIGKMEKGYIPISAEYAYLLSKIFKCDPQWLRGLTNIKTQEERDNLFKDNAKGIWQASSGEKSGDIGVVVGGNIKRYRAKRGVTDERLSAATGIPLETIRSYEENAGAASAKDLDKISNALKIKIATLYGQLPAPADITQWTVKFSNGDSVGGHISFVVGQIMGKLNSDGHEAALCMLHGLLENPRYQNKEETLDGQKEGEQ